MENTNLSKIEGIDLSDGLKYCGSQQAFEKFLHSFYNMIDPKTSEIENAYNNRDISFYTTKVHALKSSSRIIGAKELSTLAESLEMAGKSGDQAFIDANTGKLLDLYRSYKDKLSDYINGCQSDNCGKKPLTKDELVEITSAMKDLASFEDYDSIEMAIRDLKSHQLTDTQQEAIDAMDRALQQLDWDKLRTLVDKM